MKTLITDYVEDAALEKEILGEVVTTKEDFNNLDIDSLLVWHQEINDQFLDQYPNVQFVVRYGVGYDSIDIESVKRRGVKFANNPSYGVDEVSNTALSFVMEFLRATSFYKSIAEKVPADWQENTIERLRRPQSMRFGVIGAGRIGSALLRKVSVLGFKDVSIFDPFLSEGYEKALGCKRYNSIDEIFGNCDIISIHCPLNTSTKGILTESVLRKMREGAALINTARGGLFCNEDGLISFLNERHDVMIYTDVLPEEPPKQNFFDKLMNQNIYVTPHTAYYTREAYKEMRQLAARKIKDFRVGNPVVTEI